MSIISSIYADAAEKKRLEWLDKLKAARDARDWDKLDAVIAEIEKFYFAE